jgi:hypothetical protein
MMERDEGFSIRAWKTMQPQFEGDVSLINFIWELKDFKKYVKLLFDLDKILHKSAPLLSKIRSALRRMNPATNTTQRVLSPTGNKVTWKDPSKLAAEANLWYRFEVLPTLADIAEIANQLSRSAESAQQKYVADGKNGLKRHYSETHQVKDVTYGSLNNYFISNGLVHTTKRVAEYQCTYDYKVRKGMDLIRQHWGLNLTSEAVWNMIPLSFLADYFFSVSKTLHMLRADKNTSAALRLYGESVKFTQSQGGHLVHDPRSIGFVIDGKVIKPLCPRYEVLVAGHEYVLYKRAEVEPRKYGIVAPRFKTPTRQQVYNMVSLARCMF